jgi:drug/metabolite transporter (DMT)-like permease
MTVGPGELYSIACALAWAIAVVLFKKSGESLPPLPLNLFKNLLGLALMLLTVLAVSGLAWPGIPASAVVLTLISGFLGIGLGDTLYFKSLNAIGASRMAVAQTLYSPFVILLSAIFLAERLGLLQFAGVALVLGGILLVNWGRAPVNNVINRGASLFSLFSSGVALGGLSVFLMAAGVVIAKPLLERYDFLWIVTLRIVGGTLGLLIVTAYRRNGGSVWRSFRHVRHWPAVIAGSILGTYISMMLWLAGYKYTKASIASVLNETAAVFILVLAAIFLRDRLKPRQLFGSAVAVVGVFLVVAR